MRSARSSSVGGHTVKVNRDDPGRSHRFHALQALGCISGKGTATIKLTGRLPKLGNGKCNESTSATPIEGTTTWFIDVSGPVTLP
jgi:hypothetical protein